MSPVTRHPSPVTRILSPTFLLLFLVLFAALTSHNKAEAFYRTLTFDRDGSGWIFYGSFFYGDPPHDYYFYYPVPHQFNVWVSDPLNPPHIIQTAVPGDSDRFDKWETNDPVTNNSTNPTISYYLNQNTTTTAKFVPWSIGAVSLTANGMNAAMRVYVDRNLDQVNLSFPPSTSVTVYNTQAGNVDLYFNQNDFLLFGVNQISITGKKGNVERSVNTQVTRTNTLHSESQNFTYYFFGEGLGLKSFPGNAHERCHVLNYAVQQFGDTTKNISSTFNVNFLNNDWYTNSSWTARHRYVLSGYTENWTTMPNVTGASQQYTKTKGLTPSNKWTSPIKAEFQVTGIVYNSPLGSVPGTPMSSTTLDVNF